MPSPAVLGVVAASVLWVLETAVVEPATHVGTVDLLTETCQRAAVPNRLSIVPASGVCQQTVLSNALGMLASKRVTAGAREYQACMGSTKHAWGRGVYDEKADAGSIQSTRCSSTRRCHSRGMHIAIPDTSARRRHRRHCRGGRRVNNVEQLIQPVVQVGRRHRRGGRAGSDRTRIRRSRRCERRVRGRCGGGEDAHAARCTATRTLHRERPRLCWTNRCANE